MTEWLIGVGVTGAVAITVVLALVKMLMRRTQQLGEARAENDRMRITIHTLEERVLHLTAPPLSDDDFGRMSIE